MEKRKVIGLDIHLMRPLLEGLLKNMEGGVFTVDLDKRITLFNKRAEWITGYCLDEVLGQACYEVFKSSICQYYCPFDKVLKSGTPVNINGITITGKDGARIITSRTCMSLKDVHGQVRGMTTIFRDISELNDLRQQLLQSEKLALMGQLVTGVAHEINSPLSGILMYVSLLIKKLDENDVDPVTWKSKLKLVERETARIGRLVKDLLNFTRKNDPDLRPVSPKQLVEETLSLLEEQFVFKNIAVVKNLDQVIPDILGDFNQLQQVLINIVLNAIHAVERKGQIRITLSAVGAKGSQCFVHLEVWDNGVGISKEDLDKVFEPFYTTKTGDEGGVGLGLSIAKQIIDAHNGRITIQSEVGKGTNVSVRLPTV